MTLKIHINGTSKRLVTPLRTFVGGSLTRLSKGFTFVNGQKVQLWGNTRTQFFSIPFNYGYDNDILYIDDNYLYTYGTTFQDLNGGSMISKQNCLCVYDISNPTTADRTSYVQWGSYPLFSPSESDSNNYIYYITNGSTRNKVNINNTGSPSIAATYSGQSGMFWCVPLADSKNLWGRKAAASGYYNYTLGYNSTTVATVSESGLANPAWDNGNLVITGKGFILRNNTDSGSNTITNLCYITSKMVDGTSAVVAGYKTTTQGSANKVAKYNLTNNSTIWEHVFDDDRRVDIIGAGTSKYYVVDKPVDFNASDINVYLRIYNASDGQELESSVIDYRTESDARIIGWKTTPVKAVNGVLPMRWFNSGKMYICKVFVD